MFSDNPLRKMRKAEMVKYTPYHWCISILLETFASTMYSCVACVRTAGRNRQKKYQDDRFKQKLWPTDQSPHSLLFKAYDLRRLFIFLKKQDGWIDGKKKQRRNYTNEIFKAISSVLSIQERSLGQFFSHLTSPPCYPYLANTFFKGFFRLKE